MALTAGLELKPGDETEIEFTPPYSGTPIRIRGIVRNRSGYRYGMEFVAADAPGVRTGRPPAADAGGNAFHMTLIRRRL